jgi:putative alpha-1,2-mannosidase
VLGTPLFKKATIYLENGKTFVISAPASSEKNLYIDNATLNGQPYGKNWISHFDIQKGGQFNLSMSPVPNKVRGTETGAYPYSFSTDKYVQELVFGKK